MASSDNDLRDLLARAQAQIDAGVIEPVDDKTSAACMKLIQESKDGSERTAKNLKDLSAKVQESAKDNLKEHKEFADLLVNAKQNVKMQQEIGERNKNIYAIKQEIMVTEHEISEEQEKLKWMHKNFDDEEEFMAAYHAQEIEGIQAEGERRVKYLLANECNAHIGIGAKQPLHRALMNGDLALVKKLIADGADVNRPDSNGCYPICDIVAFNIPNSFEILAELIAAGANVNQETKWGWTPLNLRSAKLIGIKRDPRTLDLLKQHNAQYGKNPRFVVSGWQESSSQMAKEKATAERAKAEINKAQQSQEIGGGRLQEILAQQRAIESFQNRIIEFYLHHDGPDRERYLSRYYDQIPPVKEKLPQPVLFSSKPSGNMSFDDVKAKYSMPIPAKEEARSEAKPNASAAPAKDERNVFEAFFDGVVHEYSRTGKYIGEELARISVGHETKIIGALKSMGKAIGEDLARWKLGQDSFLRYTLMERGLSKTVDGALKFTKENVVNAIDKLKNATINEYAEFLGGATGTASMGWAGGKAFGMAEEGFGAAANKLPGATKGIFFQKELSSKSLAELAKPIDMALVKKLEEKGWTVVVARKGMEEFKYLTSQGAEASVAEGFPKHIIIKDTATKSALLEEFLHGTQLKRGLLEKYGSHQALEVHVKDFMLRHAKLLGLDNPNDIKFLQQLKIEEINRLNRLGKKL